MKALYLQSLYYKFQENISNLIHKIDIAECGECGNQSVVNVVIRFIYGVAPSTKRKTQGEEEAPD